jgi:hypothetical protein
MERIRSRERLGDKRTDTVTAVCEHVSHPAQHIGFDSKLGSRRIREFRGVQRYLEAIQSGVG